MAFHQKRAGDSNHFFAEIHEEADYLEFTKTDYFTFTPNKIDIKGKKKIDLEQHEITIKCIKEFPSDQTIELKAYKEQHGIKLDAIAGKICVWANDEAKHKEKKLVFVKIKTKLSVTSLPQVPNVNNEKKRINQYLSQADIKLSDNSDIIELDLTAETSFKDYVTNGKIDKSKTSGGKQLQDYLKDKLEKVHPGKYKGFFYAFYFAEDGYHTNGLLSGYSSYNADYVVAFKSRNDQTAAHEFLHAMNLAHTFTNKEASSNTLFTYQYKKTDSLLDYSHHDSGNENKRCSLFYWQWKQANNSIK